MAPEQSGASVTFEQVATLVVLAAVVAALIVDKVRSDIVALTGAAFLLMAGVVRPVEVQSAFASPAIIALASLFVIAYAMELSGLLDAAIRLLVRLCGKIGRLGIWITIGISGGASAFLNNTPIVVLTAPVIRDVAKSLNQSPKTYLIPLSYAAVLGGTMTLIGTSTNLLVNDMATVAGQPRFGIFEITPVGVIVAIVGGLYLFLFSSRLIKSAVDGSGETDALEESREPGLAGGQMGSSLAFAKHVPLHPLKAFASASVFVAVVAFAAFGVAPIAACAFAGAVLLILMRVITADEAYRGLRPEVLMLIAGMVVLGIALDTTGLAGSVSTAMIHSVTGLSPTLALIMIYAITVFSTEILSNATVAVLYTPIAVSLAEAMGVSPRPFLVAIMMGGSAAFATPFGYQTNTIVYQLGGYNYLDFMKVGLPLNVITLIAGVIAIRIYFPF
jgi:di/tricarboxylate transporter